jgi:hypothetical protein
LEVTKDDEKLESLTTVYIYIYIQAFVEIEEKKTQKIIY